MNVRLVEPYQFYISVVSNHIPIAPSACKGYNQNLVGIYFWSKIKLKIAI